ncbi:MAG: hypothetical protein Q8S19_03275, partial [Bacillota bacterium]|nr:hypothetical protein [Bacillota bacterium]
GTISGSLQELPIVENAPDREALRNLIAQSTVEYANLILENYVRYSNSPAIRSELPHIMKIALQPDVEAVRELIGG